MPTSPEPTAAFEGGYYDRQYKASAFHARGDKPILNRTRVRVLRKVAPGGALLDVGCGEGHFLRRARATYAVSGVDISAEGIAAAKQNTGLASLQVAGADALPFPDASFEVVTCFDVVEHLPAPAAFFAEAARLLKPGGVLLFSTPNTRSWGAKRKGQASFMHQDPTHCSLHPPEHWRALLEAHGLRVIRDGTEPLWDAPYLPAVPRALQKLAFVGSAQLLWTLDIMFPWQAGENYVCMARKPAP